LRLAWHSTRRQGENRRTAPQLLHSQLYEIALRTKEAALDTGEGRKKRIDWGCTNRSYVTHPSKLVTDLRTDIEASYVQAVMDGDLNEFIKAFLMEFGSKK